MAMRLTRMVHWYDVAHDTYTTFPEGFDSVAVVQVRA